MYDYTRVFAHLHKQSVLFYATRLKEIGIHSGQFPPLMCVCDNPGLTQDQIAIKTRADKSTVAKTVKQLMAAKLVKRTGNPEDKRSYHIYPTQKAWNLYPIIAEEKRKWHEFLTSDLTEAEQAILRMLLDKLRLE